MTTYDWPTKTRPPGSRRKPPRVPRPVADAARRIWTEIRNAPLGARLDSDHWEQLIETEVMRLIDPFRTRAHRCVLDRRDAVANCNAACAIVSRMRGVLRQIGATNGRIGTELLRKATGLGKTEFSHLRMERDPPDEAEPQGDELDGDPQRIEVGFPDEEDEDAA